MCETDFSTDQMVLLYHFLSKGGRLVLVGDWHPNWEGQSAFNALLAELGVTIQFDLSSIDGGCNITPHIYPDQITDGVVSLYYGGTCDLNIYGDAHALVFNGTLLFALAAVDRLPGAPDRPGYDVVAFSDNTFFTDDCSPTNEQLWTNLYDFTPTPFIATGLHLDGHTFVTKSVMNFTACYTNMTNSVLGDDEVVEPKLRALLYANSGSAGFYSSLLERLPILSPGQVYCDHFAVTVPRTKTTPNIQKILRVPMRAELRVKINGRLDTGSQSFAAFRIEERGASDQYWLIGNDEGHDTDMTDGVGGTTTAAMEIGPLDSTFGNEGYGAVNYPARATDAVGMYHIPPPNSGFDLAVLQADFSSARWPGGSPSLSSFALYRNRVGRSGRYMPDLTSPIYGPSPFMPVDLNTNTGGDHCVRVYPSGVSVPGGHPIWAVLHFWADTTDTVGVDGGTGMDPGEPGQVDFQATFWSTADFVSERNRLQGNWIVAIKVYDTVDAFPSGSATPCAGFSGWKEAVITGIQ